MKGLILLSVIFAFNVQAQAFEAKSGVYCRDNDRKYVNVLSGDWDTCQSELYQGDVCFTGNRGEVIKILNSDKVRQKYDGTDGEYIKNARYWGRDSIQFDSVDEANEWSDKRVIERCD